MQSEQTSAVTYVRIDQVELPYGYRAELKDILVHSDFRNPTLEACPVAEKVRKELLDSKSIKDRMDIVANHLYIVAAVWTECSSRNESRKYIEYEIVALKTEGAPKAILFLSGDTYQLIAIAILGMQEFDDFKSIRSKLKHLEGAYEIGGTFGRYLSRNTRWENTPVRLYSANGDLFFSGIYRYSTAFNGNKKRELFSDEGVNLDDKELCDMVLDHFPEYWQTLV